MKNTLWNGCQTLIDNAKVLTAYHVFSELIPSGPIVCVFNYFKKSAADFPVMFDDAARTKPYVLVNTSNIYDILETALPLTQYQYHYTIAADGSSPVPLYDWCVLTLSRNAGSAQKRMCYYSGSDIAAAIGVGYQELCTWGHPKGLPLIFTDDAHGKSTIQFCADMDIYKGNSGGAVLVKKNSDNASTFAYKIVGVLSGGQLDYNYKTGTAGGTSSTCISDVYLKPASTDLNAYVQISRIDDLFTKSMVATTNCNIQFYPPAPDPKPTPSTMPVSGTRPVVSFRADATGQYFVTTKYQKNSLYLEYWRSVQISCNSGDIKSIATAYIPEGLDYTWQVNKAIGGVPFSGSGHADGSAVDYFANIPATAPSMACVGDNAGFDYKTIQSAIDNSPAGTTLHIAPGVYKEKS